VLKPQVCTVTVIAHLERDGDSEISHQHMPITPAANHLYLSGGVQVRVSIQPSSAQAAHVHPVEFESERQRYSEPSAHDDRTSSMTLIW
jgi:hypothetical protein